jgi:two-component system sensor histidine kinase/response regulator
MEEKKKLLLVDDDATVLAFLGVKLGREFDVITCDAARKAIDLAREYSPHLILCDIDMPDMDGGDLSAQLFSAGETRDIPLLFLTALLTPDELGLKQNQLAGRAAVSKHAPFDAILAAVRQSLA